MEAASTFKNGATSRIRSGSGMENGLKVFGACKVFEEMCDCVWMCV